MRNLKRVLSLALALVMVLGMMVITTSAADFTDAEEITYTESVDVMSALGILKGYEKADGTFTFNPKGTLNRQEAAKIIAFVCMGDGADEYLTGSTVSFTDVEEDHWAAKYIAFCKNAKIVDGVNDAKTLFNPTGTLTTVQFAKMLLGALGIEGSFTGAGWEEAVKNAVAKVNTMAATGIKIDNTDITREEACELALAAMQYSVAPDVYEVRYTDNTMATYEKIGEFTDKFEATMYCKLLDNDYGMVFVNAGEDTIEDTDDDVYVGVGYYVQKAAAKDTLLSDNYGVSAADDHDEFGRPGVRYTSVIDEEFDLFFADKALVTYTAPVKAEDITKAYAKYNWAGVLSEDNIVNNADYGVVVEVYSSVIAGVKTVTDVVVIEEVLGKVTKVTEAKGEAKRTVTVAGMAFETESFAKDDIVLYTVGTVEGEAAIMSMVAPETVVGKLDAYNSTAETVTIGGVTYHYGYDFSLSPDFENAYTFTLYSDGSIADQAQAQSAATAVSTDYVYVVSAQYNKGGATNLIQSTQNAAKAEVIFADGTYAVIDLSIYKDAVTKKDVVDAPVSNGSVGKKTELNTAARAAVENWFAYTANEDGTYTLSAISDKYAAVLSEDAALEKDTMAKLDGKYTTKNTAITSVDSTNKMTVTKMTGFVDADLDVENTVGEETYSNLVLVTYASKTATTVSAVYAVFQDTIDTTETTTYAYAVKEGNAVADGIEWVFAIEGEQVTYVIDDENEDEVAAGNLYVLTEGEDCYTATAKNGDLTGTALVTVIDGNQVAISSGSVLTLSDKVKVYNVDDTAEVVGEAKTLAVGDIINYIVDNDKVTEIWVYGVEATVEAKTTTLAATLATVPAGTTITLADGTYSAITLDGTQAANLTIVGNGANTVVAGINATADVDGLTLKNIKFTAGIDMYNQDAIGVTSVTVTGCQFVGTGEDDNSIAILIGANSGKISITDNVIDGFDYGIQLISTANTEIIGNIIKNTHDRAIRTRLVAANVVVTINDNAMTKAKDPEGEVFKVGYTGYNAVASGAKITFSGNTYDGAAWDPADITTASVDAIAYTVADGQ